jgi:hypothetical protein
MRARVNTRRHRAGWAGGYVLYFQLMKKTTDGGHV